MMAQFFQLGGSMFIMSIQYLMARDLVCHPEEYKRDLVCHPADKIVATDRIMNDFKQARSVLALLQMLTTTCAHPISRPGGSPTAPNRNLLDELRRAATPSTSRGTTSTATMDTNAKLQSLKRAISKTAAT